MNNVNQLKKDECCGCSACYSICPVNAIKMERDEEGFLYPKINKDLCINCGLCLKVCKDKYNYLKEKQFIKVYAAKNNNEDILKKSSSGGMSYALSKHFIKNGGIVYGVVYDNNNKVIVEREENSEDIEKLYGSKYVQADPKNTFKQVYEDLKDNKKILYIATSCYISGLKSYLNSKNIEQDNLYTVDLICHGTPSPKLFEDYIKYLESKYNFEHFEFRTKIHPWGYGSKNFGCTIYKKDGKFIVDTVDSKLYLNLFFKNFALRPYCHNCKFAKVEKPADITIADYWGIKDEHPDFFDEKGVSAVITHTQKGDELLKTLKDITYIESTIEKVKRKQGNLNSPSPANPNREEFWNLYKEKGFKVVSKKYLDLNIKEKYKNKLKNLLIKFKIMER